MKYSGSLDTSAILRLLLGDIPAQHEAVKTLITGTKGMFAVADTAVIELVFVLTRYYEFTRPQVAEAVHGFMQLEMIDCNRMLFTQAMTTYLEHPALSFEDSCLSAYATIDQAAPLWTFDKKLARQADSAALIR